METALIAIAVVVTIISAVIVCRELVFIYNLRKARVSSQKIRKQVEDMLENAPIIRYTKKELDGKLRGVKTPNLRGILSKDTYESLLMELSNAQIPQRDIARIIGCAQSTINRDINRLFTDAVKDTITELATLKK